MRVFRMGVEMFRMAQRNRTYVLIPLLFTLAVIAVLAFYVAPGALMTFVYAGV